jgi:hypothetical protein
MDESLPVPSSQAAAPPPEAPPRSRAAERALHAARLAARLAFDLLVIDAAVESWMAGSPLRLGFAAAAALYLGLTAYVVSKGGRVGGRGWLMDPLAGAVVFLGFLVACSWSKDGLVHGVNALRQPTPAVLAGTMIALVVLAAARIVGPGGARSWWIRVPVALVSAYAGAMFWMAIRARAPFIDLLTGHGYWRGVPWWIQGTWIGAFVLPPVAFLREVGASIARLEAEPHLRWMFVFGVACWIVFNVAGL